MEQTLSLLTSDGYRLAATLFSPSEKSRKILVINSATGVKRQVYFSFAKYLRENGYYVLCYDYRGIGESKPADLRGFHASMRLWGERDFRAVTTYLKSEFKDFKTYVLGHSVGALILGMNPDSVELDKLVFVGTQKAHLSNLDFKYKLLGLLGFGVFQPLSTWILGYFPSPLVGVGERLPKGVAFDWRTLIMNKKSTNRLLEKSLVDVSHKLTQRVLVLRASDDVWLTKEGVESLLNETYPNLRPECRVVEQSESPKGEIGHINYFRSYNKGLWSEITHYLKD